MLPAPRGVSPVAASFLASLCQGIHRVPFTTCRFVVCPTMLVVPSRQHDVAIIPLTELLHRMFVFDTCVNTLDAFLFSISSSSSSLLFTVQFTMHT